MRIGLRILLGHFAVLGLAAWFVLNVFVEEVKPGVRETLEDTLVDTAQLLADLVVPDLKAGRLEQSDFAAAMHAYAQRSIDVTIRGISKETLDYRVYVTDRHGIVVFDSEGKSVGKDYSRWNDVRLTLQGKYGARSTRDNPADDRTSVMHVAAPVRDGSQIIGVLTVAKPIATVQPFIERSQQKILRRSVALLAVSLLAGGALALWLTLSLRRLERYAAEVESGGKAVLPALGQNEIGALGRALERMRVKLEGRQYTEELMHTLAHELKSPIAAIQGAAELLREEMPDAERQRFLGNILEQNLRQKSLIDKLLALVKLERQQSLDGAETLDLGALAALVASDCAARLAARSLTLKLEAGSVPLRGDPLLLRQALGNLLDNAADFAPKGSQIILRVEAAGAAGVGDRVGDGVGQRNPGGRWALATVCDLGAGIPDFALPKVFERFYSLPRPDGAKSTGLGLPFVREVALLHGGHASVANLPGGGCRACLALPLPD